MELDTLRKVNLNLLTVFELLMETRSATETAARLHTTQPGISRKLAELRRLFADPLFVLVKRQLVPTPRAVEIRPTVREALAAIGGLMEDGGAFDPLKSTRTFRIAARHTLEWMLAPGLRSHCDIHAPMVRFSFVNMQGVALPEKQLEDHSVDIALGRFEEVGPRFRSQGLFDDDRVCLMRHGHPASRRRLTPAVFSALRFVTTTDMYGKDNEVDTWLRQAGYQRAFDLYVSSMSHVPLILLQTDLAVTMPRKLANYIARFHPLHVKDLGFHLPKSHYNMVWHARWDDVPSHRWMRQAVAGLIGVSAPDRTVPALSPSRVRGAA
ncbi:LysR family transcriptional regulator [Achromobacter aloeverae]|uniref:LysR family transcriptional regulator n=1 Tax=Achromobacter aloeverae TaxID=1750518 RepID=UPI001864437A|nr:LysR family transcriptional regulator [Achromobacter aloeverae]